MERIYLDNAATSWPKPEPVYQAVDRYQREVGAAAGRGAYQDAERAAAVVEQARSRCANLIGAKESRLIAWASNGTDALNMALYGLLREKDRVVTTVCEHNSVLRPLATLRRRKGIEATFVPCDPAGFVDPTDVARLVADGPQWVVVSHASNVTGALQPLADIAHVVHQAGAWLLVDAAQTLGHVPIDVERMGIDALAASGHKGLLGPLGTGLVYVRPELERLIEPLRQGGTGSDSRSELQPERLPERLEAGNLNVPALAGLAAAAEFLNHRTVEAIAAHELTLCRRLWDGCAAIPKVRVYGPSAAQPRATVVSFAVKNYDPQDVAAILDASFGIQCRAGLHCAPRMHQALGTDLCGGLVRLSPGWASTVESIDATLSAIATIASNAV